MLRYLVMAVELIFLCMAILAAWLLVREVIVTPRGWRAALIVLSLVVVLLCVLQLATGYSLAWTYAPFAINVLSAPAYFLAMILLWTGRRARWQLNRIAAGVGIGIPFLALIISWRGIALALALFFGMHGIRPLDEGRISPTLSYRIVINHSLVGATPWYGYDIYRNPRWLPLVEKRVASGTSYCATPGIVPFQSGDITVRRGQDKNTVRVSCQADGRDSAPEEIPLN